MRRSDGRFLLPSFRENAGLTMSGVVSGKQKGDMKLFAPAFRRAKEAGLKVTIHFGEAAATSSDEELRTLLSFEPDRIGHVIHVSPAIKEEIVARKLALELCISCNVHAKMAFGSYPDHHFGEWWAKRDTNPVILCVSSLLRGGGRMRRKYG